MKFVAILLTMFVLAVPAVAADVDGKWTGTVNTGDVERRVNFTFKADGAKLTGKMTSSNGSEVDIADGKVEGQNIAFKVTFDVGGMPLAMNYEGVVSPPEMKLTAKTDLMPAPTEIALLQVPEPPAEFANLAHIHIVLNHVPSLGSLAGLMLLAVALYAKNDKLKRFSFLVLVVVALAVLPTYLTGVEAQSMVRGRPAVMPGIIQVHQNAAMVTLVLMTFAGTFAWFGLWEFRRHSRASSLSTMGTLIMTALSAAMILFTASLGGKVSHPEVREVVDAAVGVERGWREPIEQFMNDNAWSWPAAETLHFVGMAALFGVSLLLLMRMLGAMKSIPFTGLHRLLPMGILGFVLNVFTGMLFYIASPGLYLGKDGFYIKMVCILLAAIPILYFTLFDEPWQTGKDANAPVGAKIAAVCTFGLLVAVIIYGRFLPFLT
jgi:hypothetical protein